MAFRLDHGSSVPLYQQLREHIRGVVTQATPGERLFTDDELAERFGVHRLTVRQAVQELVRQGLLYRVRGVGTFAADPAVRSRFRAVESFFIEWTGQGHAVDVEQLEFEMGPCPQPFAEWLDLHDGEQVLCIGRRRWVDEEPFAVDRRFVRLPYAKAIRRRDVVVRPLFETIAERLGVAVIDGHNELQAVRAGEDAQRLRVAEHAPVLLRRLVLFAEARAPVLAGTTTYRGDRFIYSFGGDTARTGGTGGPRREEG